MDDVSRFSEMGAADGVVACNEMIARWPGRLDAAVTLHPEKMSGWLAARRGAGFPDPDRIVISDRYKDWFTHAGISSGIGFIPDIMTEAKVPGQRNAGSSGLFAVKVALIDLGFDRVVCCGIPMTLMGHVDDPSTPWNGAPRHQGGWFEGRTFLKRKVRSMSGWASEFLGAPDQTWIDGR